MATEVILTSIGIALWKEYADQLRHADTRRRAKQDQVRTREEVVRRARDLLDDAMPESANPAARDTSPHRQQYVEEAMSLFRDVIAHETRRSIPEKATSAEAELGLAFAHAIKGDVANARRWADRCAATLNQITKRKTLLAITTPMSPGWRAAGRFNPLLFVPIGKTVGYFSSMAKVKVLVQKCNALIELLEEGNSPSKLEGPAEAPTDSATAE